MIVAFLVDEEGLADDAYHTLAAEFLFTPNAICVDARSIDIGEKWEVQVELVDELLVRVEDRRR